MPLPLAAGTFNGFTLEEKTSGAGANGVNRCLESFEVPSGPKLYYTSAIGTAETLQGNGFFGKIEKTVDESVTPKFGILAIRAALRPGPNIVSHPI